MPGSQSGFWSKQWQQSQWVKWSESRSVMSDTLWPHGLYTPWNSPGQNTEVSGHSFLQGIFPTQGWNPGLLHCRWILYQLSHQRSPWILEWVAYPFSSGSSRPMNRTRVSCIAGKFFTNWATREALRVCEHTSILKKQYLHVRSNKKLFKDILPNLPQTSTTTTYKLNRNS